MIVLTDVTKSYGARPVLEHVTLQINPGEFVCIVGPSGSGKSTLIRLLVGAEQISAGSIEVDGVDLRHIPAPILQLYRRRVGVVFQDYKLIAHRTVAENIAFPLQVCGVPDREVAARVQELLIQMNLTAVASSAPDTLSGGEQARTAIARAIAHHPMVVLADEPTGNLDPKQAWEIFSILKSINETGTTIVLATHDRTLVEKLQTRVVQLGNGRIVSDATGAQTEKMIERHEILRSSSVTEAASAVTHTPSDTTTKKKVKVTMIHS